MININPKVIQGNWDVGFVLDVHTISSEYVGDDEYGHPQFDTKRSEMGELLYQLKYSRDISVLEPIVTTTADFIRENFSSLDLLIPVPPSRPRSLQPVIAIAKRLAESLEIPLCTSCVVKVRSNPELKNIYEYSERIKILESAYRVDRKKVESKNVLLFDDLYRSGATMNAVSTVLKNLGHPAKINTLTLTLSRRKR